MIQPRSWLRGANREGRRAFSHGSRGEHARAALGPDEVDVEQLSTLTTPTQHQAPPSPKSPPRSSPVAGGQQLQQQGAHVDGELQQRGGRFAVEHGAYADGAEEEEGQRLHGAGAHHDGRLRHRGHKRLADAPGGREEGGKEGGGEEERPGSVRDSARPCSQPCHRAREHPPPPPPPFDQPRTPRRRPGAPFSPGQGHGHIKGAEARSS